jgi:hypothetical protein
MEFRVARTREELEAAFSLVHREYCKRGYVEDGDSSLRVILHNALPQTATFVALDEGGRVRGTATVVPDSQLGLPMDECYRDEMTFLRERGKVCEIVMLALETGQNPERTERRSASPAVFRLFKVLVDYARLVLEADFICVAVNPRHEAAFDHFHFQSLGGLKTYRSVNGAPALAKYLEFASLEKGTWKTDGENRHAVFGGPPTDSWAYEGKFALTKVDLDYFFRDRSDVFSTASSECLDYIAACYDGGEISPGDAKGADHG